MRIRLHWLLIATAVLSIVCWIGAMWALERANRRAYVRDTQALIDAGFVVDWDTVAAGIAPADPAALATWTAWCAHAPRVEEDSSLTQWIRHGRGAPPPAAQELVEAHRADMASVLPLVRDGRLHFGIRASLHDWLSGPRDPNQLIDVMSNLSGTRALAQWLRWQALTADDPIPWLDDLDRLVAGGDPPLCLMDGMIGIVTATNRDETRFAHIRWLGGRLDAEHPWLAPIDDLQELSATLWMGERLFSATSMDAFLNGDLHAGPSAPATWQESLMGGVNALNPLMYWQWATLPAGASYARWTLASFETNLRGDPPPPPPSGVGGAGNWLTAIAIPNLLESHVTIGEHYLRARILRMAARLIIDHRDGIAIPSDAAELSARYGNVLAALPGSVPVLYTREADGGFTLAGDITVPISTMATLRKDQRVTVPGVDLALGQP